MPISSSPDPSDNYGDLPQGRWSGHASDSPLDGWSGGQPDSQTDGQSDGGTRAYDFGYGAPQQPASSNPLPGYAGSGDGGQQLPGYGSTPGYGPQGYNANPAYGAYPGQGPYGGPPRSQKSMVVAAVLAFFLGGTGAHNFYIGNFGRAIAQVTILVLSVIAFVVGLVLVAAGVDAEEVTSYGGTTYYSDNDGMMAVGGLTFLASFVAFAALGVWAIIEFILILCGTGSYGKDRDGVPLST